MRRRKWPYAPCQQDARRRWRVTTSISRPKPAVWLHHACPFPLHLRQEAWEEHSLFRGPDCSERCPAAGGVGRMGRETQHSPRRPASPPTKDSLSSPILHAPFQSQIYHVAERQCIKVLQTGFTNKARLHWPKILETRGWTVTFTHFISGNSGFRENRLNA